MKPFPLILAALLMPMPLMAQNPGFSGSFSSPGQNGTIVVTLQSAGNGQYTGTMSNGTLTWQLRGELSEGALTGTVNTGQAVLGFEAHVAGSQLQLILVPIGPDGTPQVDRGQELQFMRAPGPAARAGSARAGGNPTTAPPPAAGASGQTGGPVDNSPLARQWRAQLAGKKVTYISSYSSNTVGGGGLSTRYVYHLCSDGRFAFYGSDVVSHNMPDVGAPGGGSMGANGGTWRIVTQGQVAGIELRFGNGQTELYRLDRQGGQTYANGNRVYVTPGELCR